MEDGETCAPFCRIVSRRINGGHARPGEPPAKRSAFDSLVLRSGLALRMTGTGKLAQKYGHLRGAEVEPCDKSVQRFYEIFGKPVPFVFRSATNEILYLSHLDVVNARFEYDVVWATGLFSTCDVFFQGIEESLRLELFNALIKALKLDPVKVKADAESVLVWAQGKNEGDVVKAMNGEDTSEIGKVLSKAKSSDEDDFLYTRNFGAGLIKVRSFNRCLP